MILHNRTVDRNIGAKQKRAICSLFVLKVDALVEFLICQGVVYTISVNGSAILPAALDMKFIFCERKYNFHLR